MKWENGKMLRQNKVIENTNSLIMNQEGKLKWQKKSSCRKSCSSRTIRKRKVIWSNVQRSFRNDIQKNRSFTAS